jgi:hypothetical protein
MTADSAPARFRVVLSPQPPISSLSSRSISFSPLYPDLEMLHASRNAGPIVPVDQRDIDIIDVDALTAL